SARRATSIPATTDWMAKRGNSFASAIGCTRRRPDGKKRRLVHVATTAAKIPTIKSGDVKAKRISQNPKKNVVLKSAAPSQLQYIGKLPDWTCSTSALIEGNRKARYQTLASWQQRIIPLSAG